MQRKGNTDNSTGGKYFPPVSSGGRSIVLKIFGLDNLFLGKKTNLKILKNLSGALLQRPALTLWDFMDRVAGLGF